MKKQHGMQMGPSGFGMTHGMGMMPRGPSHGMSGSSCYERGDKGGSYGDYSGTSAKTAGGRKNKRRHGMSY